VSEETDLCKILKEKTQYEFVFEDQLPKFAKVKLSGQIPPCIVNIRFIGGTKASDVLTCLSPIINEPDERNCFAKYKGVRIIIHPIRSNEWFSMDSKWALRVCSSMSICT